MTRFRVKSISLMDKAFKGALKVISLLLFVLKGLLKALKEVLQAL